MAQVDRRRVEVANRGVGWVSVDGGALRGEEGPARPQLVVPLTVSLDPSPKRTVAVVAVTARLSLSDYPQPGNEACAPVTVPLVSGFPVRSAADYGRDDLVPLRFPVTAVELEALEKNRHRAGGLTLHLGIEVTVAAMRTHNDGSRDPNATGPGDGPWPADDGLMADLTYYWQPRVASPLRVEVEQSLWVRDVLPGLGHDLLRLLELRFPPPLPDNASAAAEWDKARRALDERRYGDCVAECRDLLSMWKNTLGAKGGERVADKVAALRDWPDGDARHGFLDGVWQRLTHLVNQPHHPEGSGEGQDFDAADARLVLTLTASLADYLVP